MSEDNRATRIARKIYDILSDEKCTVGEATEVLRQVECVMSVAPTVQKNEKSKEMFNCVNQAFAR